MSDGLPASTDPPRRLALPGRWGLLLYLACCLIGLALGLWPEAVRPSLEDIRTAPLPTLRCVALAQVAFILLVYPLVLASRLGPHGPPPQMPGPEKALAPARETGAPDPLAVARETRPTDKFYWLSAALESVVFLVISVPFYVPAAWLGDAVAPDAVRAALCVAAMFPVAWVAGALLARGPGRGAVLTVLLLVAVGLPAAWYVALEFLPRLRADWLVHLAPATFTWQQAASRLPSWTPHPLWAWLLWPLLAALAGVIPTVLGRKLLRD
jgi:hypothetical protein